MRRYAVLTAVTLVMSVAVVVTAFGAPDKTLTVDGATPLATWAGTPASAANLTFTENEVLGLGTCGKNALNYCEDILIQVGAAGTKLKITLDGFATTVPPVADDFDLFVYKSDAAGTPGDFVDVDGKGAGVPEVVEVNNPAPGYYLARVVYFAVNNAGYNGKAELIGAAAPAPTGTATPGPGATPPPGGPAPTPTPTPTGGGQPPGGTLPASGPLSVSFAVDRTKRATARKRGLRVRVRCSVQCKATATASLDKKSARTLKMGKRPVKIGRGSATITKPGRIPFTVKLSKKAKKALARKRVKAFKITITIKVTDRNGGQIKGGSKKLTVKR